MISKTDIENKLRELYGEKLYSFDTKIKRLQDIGLSFNKQSERPDYFILDHNGNDILIEYKEFTNNEYDKEKHKEFYDNLIKGDATCFFVDDINDEVQNKIRKANKQFKKILENNVGYFNNKNKRNILSVTILNYYLQMFYIVNWLPKSLV